MRHLALLLPLALAACATAGPDGAGILIETVVQGRPLPGVACMVSSQAGSLTLVTPARVNQRNLAGDLYVQCRQAGYRSAEAMYRPQAPGAGGSGVGLGLGGGSGNVGFGVGLAFPFGSSAPAYPARIAIEMHPL